MINDANKRRSPRVDEENALTVTPILAEPAGLARRPIPVLSKDISASGLRVCLPAFMPVKSRLKIEIRLKNPHRYASATGEIRWVRKAATTEQYEAGIEFDAQSPELARMLREYIAENT